MKKILNSALIITSMGVIAMAQQSYVRRDLNLENLIIIGSLAQKPDSKGDYVADNIWVHYSDNCVRIIKVFSGKDSRVYFAEYNNVFDLKHLDVFLRSTKWDTVVLSNTDFKQFKLDIMDITQHDFKVCSDGEQWVVYALIGGNGIAINVQDCGRENELLLKKGKALEQFLFHR